MRWVKEILPPTVRSRWALMTARFSIISFAGISRAEVAVGTPRDDSMFFTIDRPTPRMSSVRSFPVASTSPQAAEAASLERV